jgi:hypothetical protein
MKTWVVFSLGFLSLTALAHRAFAEGEGNCLGITPANDPFCQTLEETACYNDPICSWIPSDETESTGSNS